MNKFCSSCGNRLVYASNVSAVCTTCHPSWLAKCAACEKTLLQCKCLSVARKEMSSVTAVGPACPRCKTELLCSPKFGEVCGRCEPSYLAPCNCSQPVWACVCADPGKSE